MFMDLGIGSGIERPPQYPSAIFFIASSSGLLVNGSTKGYAYSDRPLGPVRKSLDGISESSISGDTVFFESLSPKWYIFLDIEQ